MAAGRGNPEFGDRASHSIADPTYHASDIEDGALEVHLPAPSADGTYARDNGANWVAQLGLLLADLTAWVRGSLIVGGVAAWEALGIGVADTVLKSNGTDPAWGNVGHDELTDITDGDHHALIHDHSAAGEGGTFDAANLTSGASTDGQVLTSDGAGAAAWEDSTGGDVGLIFSQVVDVTVANTVVETSILGSGRGSKTIPADTLDVGTIIRLTLYGYFSDTGTPTLDVIVSLGGTEVCSTGVVTLLSGIDQLGWSLNVDIVCRSTGGTGTVVAAGIFEYNDDSGHRMTKVTTTTIDTTAALLVDVTKTWGAAAAGNTSTCQMATIELLQADDLAVAAPTELTAIETV